tara:strand:- start:280 stop:510 length:231 start_codon:yes stop_codon:yes gene_type:complete
MILVREGVQMGLEKQLVKRTPSAASLSKLGDLQDSLPFEDRASYPMSSAMIKMILGLFCSVWAKIKARHEKKEAKQ